MDISAIQTWELEKDLQDSRNDIAACETALYMGITSYSGGSVQDQLDKNKHFIKIISTELELRSH